MLLGAVDPGIRHAGVSIWDEGVLQWAGLVTSPERTARGPEAWVAMARAVLECYPLGLDLLVLELQQVYPRGFGPPPDDLFQLTGVCGALAGAFSDRGAKVEGYYPRQWTHGTPKDVRLARLYEPGVLTSEEWENVEDCPKSLAHNRDDAIDLGRWYVLRSGDRVPRAPGAEVA